MAQRGRGLGSGNCPRRAQPRRGDGVARRAGRHAPAPARPVRRLAPQHRPRRWRQLGQSGGAAVLTSPRCLLRLMRHYSRSGFLPVALDSLRKAEAAALEPERQQKHFRNFATLFATREPGVDQGSRSLGDFADRVYTEPTGRLRSTPPGRGSRPCMLCRSGEGVLAAATRRPHCTRPSPRLWQRSEMSRVHHNWLPLSPPPPPTPGVRTMKCSAS